MAKQQKPKRPANPSPAEIDSARAALLRFTPEQPMFVGPVVYRQLSAYLELADLMDRVRVSQEVPSA